MESGLQALVELWDVDRELRSLRRELSSYPAEEKRRLEKINSLKQGAERIREGIRELQTRLKEIETDVSSWKERIGKLEREAYGARDNSTLYAYQHQIATLRGEIGERDDEGLGLLEQIQVREQALAAEQAKIDSEEKVLAEFRGNVEREKGQIEAKVTELKKLRDSKAGGVGSAHLQIYEKLIGSSDRQPLAQVLDRTCQNCFTELTLNDFARVRSGKMVVQCKSCHCILYTTS
jgi:predicted  nucleic acid-binding Zn-ribbon protein